MKLIKLKFLWLFLGTCLMAGDAYNYVDIEECILPISKKLYKIEAGNYTQKDYNGSLYINPVSIAIDPINRHNMRASEKAKKILHLDKKTYIEGFQVFTDNKKINSNKLVYLKNHVLLLGNYPMIDLKYMLSYCKKTQNRGSAAQ